LKDKWDFSGAISDRESQVFNVESARSSPLASEFVGFEGFKGKLNSAFAFT
jgi:hypothetical protein